jgi:hypothetical protein
MQMRTKMLVAFATTVATVVACEQATPPDINIHSSAVLSGANVKPTAVVTSDTTTGLALGTLNQTTGIFGYSVTWYALSGTVVGGAHIHGPADESNTAGVLVTFGTAMPFGGASQTNSTAVSGASAGTTSALDTAHIAVASLVTVDSLKKLFKAGLLYVDIHTTANPGGELRAQLKP